MYTTKKRILRIFAVAVLFTLLLPVVGAYAANWYTEPAPNVCSISGQTYRPSGSAYSKTTLSGITGTISAKVTLNGVTSSPNTKSGATSVTSPTLYSSSGSASGFHTANLAVYGYYSGTSRP